MSGSLADLFDEPSVDKDKIKSLIKRRRAQLLIHSAIYYDLNDNIVSDDTWQSWAEELTVLQRDNPDCCTLKYFDYDFSDWDGTTGAMLQYRHPMIYQKAIALLEYHNKNFRNSC